MPLIDLLGRIEEINRQLAAAIGRTGDMRYVTVQIQYSPGEPSLVDETLCTWPELLAALHRIPPRNPLYDPSLAPPAPIEAQKVI